MRKRTLGRTGLELGRVGFGGIKVPEISQDLASEALNTALDVGINFLGTARNYKDSQRKIGRAVGHRRDEFYIATKSGARNADGLLRDRTQLAHFQETLDSADECLEKLRNVRSELEDFSAPQEDKLEPLREPAGEIQEKEAALEPRAMSLELHADASAQGRIKKADEEEPFSMGAGDSKMWSSPRQLELLIEGVGRLLASSGSDDARKVASKRTKLQSHKKMLETRKEYLLPDGRNGLVSHVQ